MIAQLVLKELRQHWFALVLLAGLLGIGCLLIGGYLLLVGTSGSPFDTLRLFVITFVPIAALVLGNRLVAAEYRAKTQLFLEALPLSRLRLALVKYILGLGLLLGMVLLIVAVLSVWGARRENLDGSFLAMLVLRSAAFATFVYSFLFLTGFLGRYNVAIYILLLLALYLVDEQTNLELGRFGPFALVDERFAYERHEWPTSELAVTFGLSALFLALSLAMAQLREGTVAAMLGEKMSQREKIFIASLICAMVFGIYVYDERAEKEPFDLADAVEVEFSQVRVKLSSGAGEEDTLGRQLAERLAREIAELQRYLQLEELPPIFVVKRSDLDGDQFERAELEGAEGFLVRCNYNDQAWNEQKFLAWFVRELLVTASHGRVLHERKRFVLDGFGRYWVHRHENPSEADSGRLELRAAVAADRGFDPRNVENWLLYREAFGEPIAEALAWSGLVALQQSRGADAMRAVLQDTLRTDLPGDIRATLYEWRRPWSSVLQDRAGISHDEFVGAWSAHLSQLRTRRRKELDAVPRTRGMISYPTASSTTRLVTYEFECQPRPSSGRFAVLHCELPPFDAEVSPTQIQRDEFSYDTQRKGELVVTLQHGARFYWTFAIEVPELDCEVITGWSREEVP